MEIIKIDFKNPNINIIKKAVRIIRNGGLIIYPTDTSYGIGVSIFNKKSLKNVYKIKNRNIRKPLSVIVSDLKMAKQIAIISKKKEKYFQSKFPGRFTLIFKKNKKINNILSSQLKTIGIRIPNYKIISLLIKYLKIPFTATSANISGKKPCYSVSDIKKQFKNFRLIDLILDAGKLPKRNPSKIIDFSENKIKILR